MTARRYVAAIDQGTTSTRCLLVDRAGRVAALAQREHRQIYPQPGWVEHDPREILQRVDEVVRAALEQAAAGAGDIAAVGIANQRETTVVWDRATGEPLYNAIVWQDTRTAGFVGELAREGGQDRLRATTGLPLATYFAGPKARWVLDNLPGARAAAERGDALFGTLDTYLAWWLTGGPAGGRHVTDVTNAARTLLMDLRTLAWDDACLQAIGVPRTMLPEIRSSSEVYGTATGVLAGVPLAGLLGDQQAALVGQACFAPGAAKNTYGTGCFLLVNTGAELVHSTSGLLTTVAYQLDGQPVAYALEGSIAIAGALVQWLRDNLGLIASAAEVEQLALSVPDNGGVYIVPAFAGLFAPYWRSDARGVIAGLTGYATKGHLARAALEATAYQTQAVTKAMVRDAGLSLTELKVDGGMVANETLMQFQADILDLPVVRPRVAETTALGAAFAAGLAVGFWRDLDELRATWQADARWAPRMDGQTRARLLRDWQRAVERSFGWAQEGP
jgi:glycerol kinase